MFEPSFLLRGLCAANSRHSSSHLVRKSIFYLPALQVPELPKPPDQAPPLIEDTSGKRGGGRGRSRPSPSRRRRCRSSSSGRQVRPQVLFPRSPPLQQEAEAEAKVPPLHQEEERADGQDHRPVLRRLNGEKKIP